MTGPTPAGGSDPAGTEDFHGRRDRGIAAYAQIFAVPAQQVVAALTGRVGPVFTEEALQGAGGAAWAHPALTGRDRSIAIITALTAHGISGDRLDTHLQLGRKHSLDEDSFTALMTLLAGYIGYPRASQAMETVHALFAATR
jgi:4-carboxymuconolactone decarboxylase